MMRPFFLFQRYAQIPILKNMTCAEPHRGRGSETPGTKIQIMVLKFRYRVPGSELFGIGTYVRYLY